MPLRLGYTFYQTEGAALFVFSLHPAPDNHDKTERKTKT